MLYCILTCLYKYLQKLMCFSQQQSFSFIQTSKQLSLRHFLFCNCKWGLLLLKLFFLGCSDFIPFLYLKISLSTLSLSVYVFYQHRLCRFANISSFNSGNHVGVHEKEEWQRLMSLYITVWALMLLFQCVLCILHIEFYNGFYFSLVLFCYVIITPQVILLRLRRRRGSGQEVAQVWASR